MSVVDEIKSRLDIVDYVGRTVALKKAGRHYKAPCPFHAERTPSFIVNPDSQSWRCFGACAQGGDVFTFAMKQNGWTFTEALNELGKLVGVEVNPQTPEQQAKNDSLERLRGLLKSIADTYHDQLFNPHDPLAAETLHYAREKRGLSADTIKKFGIGFASPGWDNALRHLLELGYSEDDVIEAGIATRGEAGKVYDRFRNRLMIPIRDERGRVIGFGARALSPDDTPKYLNSPQTPLFDKSRILFGLDVAGRSIRDLETAVIVEGYMDAIQAHQAGFTNVVAQMGTAMTEAQLKKIAPRWAKRIVLALDADAAGQSATLRGLEVARETLQADYSGRLSVDIRILAIPGAKDPDDLIRETPEQWAQLVANATPVADYVIAVETGALPANASLQEREAVARRVLPILIASESDLYKKDSLQKLAQKLHIAERDLLLWADEQQRIAAAKAPRGTPEARPNTSTGKTSSDDGDGTSSETLTKPLFALPVQEAELEKYTLRMLFHRPELFYQVNRKFRELAADHPDLAQGPLADLSPEDFSRSDYRTLMLALRSALDQDEMEVVDYVRAQVDPRLQQIVDSLEVTDVSALQAKINHRMLADLAASIKHHGRAIAVADQDAETIEKALRLRKQRVVRDRQEIGFLQADTQLSEDETTDQPTFDRLIHLYNLAERRIDAELQRQAQFLRQF